MADPRKRPGETHERYVERLIREAQEEGAFDRLSCAGLPESLAIRLEAERVLGEIAREGDERVVRDRLEALNARIRKINRTTVAGPPTTLAPLDVEEAVRRWRAGRGEHRAPGGPAGG
jgi:hypothetical protein